VDGPNNERQDVLWCPSARPEQDAVVFAVRTGDPERAGLRYLSEPVSVTPEVLALADPVDPREVFRFGAPCATHACAHYTGSRCSLIERIVAELPTAVNALPACRLRSRCRWFAEEGEAACSRCPLVITLQKQPDLATAHAANPVNVAPRN
jgi:hypothetical protein